MLFIGIDGCVWKAITAANAPNLKTLMDQSYTSTNAFGFNSGADNYAIKVNPENSEWVKNYYVHRNIRMENNTFKQYDYPVLSAKSTNGIFFINNRIEKSDFMPAGKVRAALNFSGCTGVQIKGNQFGDEKPAIQLKDMVKSDIKSDIKFASPLKK